MRSISHAVAIGTLEAGAFDAVIDVRSPAEYAEDHIPGALSCPVLEDEERARVGTLYKQISPFQARKLGAALVARNIARHLETAFADMERDWRPLVYCWRGGKRSGAMAHVLREVGWQAKTLEGGYKSYRRHKRSNAFGIDDQKGRRQAGLEKNSDSDHRRHGKRGLHVFCRFFW